MLGRRCVIQLFDALPAVLCQEIRLRVEGRELRRGMQVFDVTAQMQSESAAIDEEDGEFQARRARVQYENCVGHRFTSN
jgi:transposase